MFGAAARAIQLIYIVVWRGLGARLRDSSKLQNIYRSTTHQLIDTATQTGGTVKSQAEYLPENDSKMKDIFRSPKQVI